MTETNTMNTTATTTTMNLSHLPQIKRMYATLPDRALDMLSLNHPNHVVREACKQLLTDHAPCFLHLGAKLP
tara:strand:- start:1182 stop:1397 length:216 start_codon:yes stop_codon:yes gene_type:complete